MTPNPYQWKDLLCVTVLVAVVLLWLNDPAGTVGTGTPSATTVPVNRPWQ